jgi:hypothetical protein
MDAAFGSGLASFRHFASQAGSLISQANRLCRGSLRCRGIRAGFAGGSNRVGLGPKFARDANRVDACGGPPSGFIAGAVGFAMMSTAERHGEFVADLEAETSGLRKPQMASQGRRAQIRQGCLATKRRWVLSRWRRTSGKATRFYRYEASSGEGAASGISASAASLA